MQAPGNSRPKDSRVDIKLSRDVYEELETVKGAVESAAKRKFSMAEVVSLLCDWAGPNIARLEESKSAISELTTKRPKPRGVQ